MTQLSLARAHSGRTRELLASLLVGASLLAGACSDCGDSRARPSARSTRQEGELASEGPAAGRPAVPGLVLKPPMPPELLAKTPVEAEPTSAATTFNGAYSEVTDVLVHVIPEATEGADTPEEVARTIASPAPEKALLSRRDVDQLFEDVSRAPLLRTVAFVIKQVKYPVYRPKDFAVLGFKPGKRVTLAKGTEGLVSDTDAEVGAELSIRMDGKVDGIPFAPILRVGSKWKATGLR